MRKKLLKFLVGYGDKDLYSELLNSDLYTFIEKHRDELQEYPGYADIESEIPHPKDAVKKAFKRYYGNSDQYIEDQAKKLDMPVEDVKKYLTALDYEAKNEAAINERKKEVANWPWYKKAIASDYAKERYIKDPESSIFSDKGEWYNKGEDISDLLYGGAGAVADFIPGVGGTVIGPAVRGMRDVQHKLYDSPYQKEWSDIGKDVGGDLLLNVGTDVLPTTLTRYAPRLVKNVKKNNAGEVVDFLTDADNYNTMLKRSGEMGDDLRRFGWDENLDNVDNFANLTERDIKRNYDKIKSPELKTAIAENGGVTLNNKGIVTDVDKDKTGDVIMDFWVSNKPGEISEGWNKFLMPDGKFSSEYKNIMDSPAGPYIDKLMKADDISKGAKNFARGERIWENFGDRAAKTIATVGNKRPSAEIKENLDKKYERWAKGFATMDEQKSDEYKQWHEQNLRTMLGLE
jgi:hypothetical protein